MLKEVQNFKQVRRARIAGRTEHAHEAFRWNMRCLGQTVETHSRVDVIAQNCFGKSDFAGQHGFEAFAQKFLAKLRVELYAVPDGFLEVASKRHGSFSYFLRL